MTLPAVNACLNTLSAVLLVAGYRAIGRRDADTHKTLMLSALAASAAFLACYLYYHYNVGSVKFQGQGGVRLIYFAILITHTVLAVVNLPLILRALALALKDDFAAHRRVARWAFPIWLYVSVSGVLVYLILYHWPVA